MRLRAAKLRLQTISASVSRGLLFGGRKERPNESPQPPEGSRCVGFRAHLYGPVSDALHTSGVLTNHADTNVSQLFASCRYFSHNVCDTDIQPQNG